MTPLTRSPLVVLGLVMVAITPLVGCGSGVSQAEKQARIKAGLTRLQDAFERERAQRRGKALSYPGTRPRTGLGAVREASRLAREQSLRRAEILVKARPPSGVSSAEWGAAVAGDEQLHPLVLGAWASGGPAAIELPAPAALTKAGGHELAQYEAGKKAVAQSGCLACHRIGNNGNPGPGQDLTQVADLLPKPAIERTLIKPVQPMPSFVHLSPEKFQAIVAFLSELK